MKNSNKMRLISAGLVLASLLTTASVFAGCGNPDHTPIPTEPTTSTTQPVDTEPTTAQPSTEPAVTEPALLFETAPDVLHIVPPLTDAPSEAYTIVKNAILRYTQYNLEGVCCDYDYIVTDLSQYLTEEQKKDYCHQQYRITCCDNIQQIREHTDHCLSKDLQWNEDPNDRLFRDGDGNLYLITNPTCYDGYGHIQVISQTKSKIVARACLFDEDGCYRTVIFTLRSGKEGYQISKEEEDKDYRCGTTVVDQGSNYQILKFGNERNAHYGYKFFHSNGELGSHNWTEYRCPIITPITEDIMELAISYGPGHVNRSYQSQGHWESYDYVVALGYGKIAYLDGDPEERVLVVCDLFDRSKSEIFEDLGFAPEAMPVTEAVFTSDGGQWTLTLTYRIGKTAEATWSVSRSL